MGRSSVGRLARVLLHTGVRVSSPLDSRYRAWRIYRCIAVDAPFLCVRKGDQARVRPTSPPASSQAVTTTNNDGRFSTFFDAQACFIPVTLYRVFATGTNYSTSGCGESPWVNPPLSLNATAPPKYCFCASSSPAFHRSTMNQRVLTAEGFSGSTGESPCRFRCWSWLRLPYSSGRDQGSG